MPILTNHRDAPEQVLQRAAQQDPWVMYLIVRQETPLSATELLLAATRATMRCADTLQHHPSWGDSFRVWGERSFRKVTLRAREPAWNKLASYDGGLGEIRGIEVVKALPPRLRSECGSLLKGLQVYNPEEATLQPEPPVGEPPITPMYFIKNPDAKMSIGKQIAQISHAVLMCAWSSWADDARYQTAFDAWKNEGYPGVLLPSSSWAHLLAEADGVVVRDAGLTEVDPGTATVMALPPGYPVSVENPGVPGGLERLSPRPPPHLRGRGGVRGRDRGGQPLAFTQVSLPLPPAPPPRPRRWGGGRGERLSNRSVVYARA